MQTITVTGTDLFQIAAEYLGDATQWIRIAQQNNLSDPQISGDPISIVIPDVDQNAGGGAPTQ